MTLDGQSLAARNRAITDIFAAEAARPLNAFRQLVGALLRLRHGVAQRRYAQHAAAAGDDVIALQARTGMEDLAVGAFLLRQPLDHFAVAIVPG